jgi:uncharacterized membrane protein YoaK (UPF0700 family)
MTRRALGYMRRLRGATRWLLPAERRYLHEEQRYDQASMARLARILAFIAGALNAGGFMALGFYTSHVTGNVSRAADELVLGHWLTAGSAAVLVAFFMVGAFTTGLLLSYGRRRRFKARYAFSLALEACLLLVFGLSGDALARESLFAPATAVLLTFVMGMHNAVITKISKAVVRTTHMTGNVTDLGIELAQLVYTNRSRGPRLKPVVADRPLLFLHLSIVISFFLGGLAGAVAFHRYGYVSALPLALFLAILSFRPLLLDLESRSRLLARHRRA